MRKDKTQAIELRGRNKSYNEINKLLGVPKSTLATWFKDDKKSQKVKLLLSDQPSRAVIERIKNFSDFNKRRWQLWREEARNEALKEFPLLGDKPLFIAGLMLYWAEGNNKPSSPFKFTNTDPRMIALYTKFLTKVLGIPKQNLRASLVLYPDLSKEKNLRFWSKIIGIPRSQFYKTQFIKGKHPTRRLSNGICAISCGSHRLREKATVWIDLLSQKL